MTRAEMHPWHSGQVSLAYQFINVSVTHSHVFLDGNRTGVSSRDTMLSPMNPMSLSCRCFVASIIAINFIGECTMVQKALPGFMNR